MKTNQSTSIGISKAPSEEEKQKNKENNSKVMGLTFAKELLETAMQTKSITFSSVGELTKALDEISNKVTEKLLS